MSRPVRAVVRRIPAWLEWRRLLGPGDWQACPMGQPPFPLPRIGPSGYSPGWVKKQIPSILGRALVHAAGRMVRISIESAMEIGQIALLALIESFAHGAKRLLIFQLLQEDGEQTISFSDLHAPGGTVEGDRSI